MLRLELRDGRVYVELKTISLSHGMPVEDALDRWLIKPLTDDLQRKMMTDILDETWTAEQRTVSGQKATPVRPRWIYESR